MPNASRPLLGEHAIVTGASRGIGAAIAAALARAGADLTILARSAARLDRRAETLRGEHGVQVTALECDVAEEASVRAAFARAVAERGTPYILVNNAGAAEAAPFASTTRALWDRMLAVNLTSTYLCASQVVPAMVAAKRGRIVNVASTAGLRGYKAMSAYCAAKHGVVGLTKGLAVELGREGITVNCVCPGPIRTGMTAGIPDEAKEKFARRRVPLRRYGDPEEVAHVTLSLLLPAASFITGAVVPVDGGLVVQNT